jgi:hypothetical protein
MNEAVLETTTPAGRVYLPAERWRVLLEALQQASRAPADQVKALRAAVVDFLDAIPAVIASGVTRPLHQLLAALLLRLAACWNQLTEELATGESEAIMAEAACAQLRAMLKFANSVAGKQITALLLPLSELQAEANLEAQRGSSE